MIHFVLAILTVCLPALARDNGQYENVTPDVRAWFRSQKSPKTGALCCNEADGLYAEEDIRDGHYWARWSGGNCEPVPDEVVIHEANPTRRTGRLVVYRKRRGQDPLFRSRKRHVALH